MAFFSARFCHQTIFKQNKSAQMHNLLSQSKINLQRPQFLQHTSTSIQAHNNLPYLTFSQGYAKKKEKAVVKKKVVVEKPKKEFNRDGSRVVTRGKKMTVIFTQRLPGVGEKGEIKEVSKGFARNFLFLYRIATYATNENRMLYRNYTKNIVQEDLEQIALKKRWKKRLSKVVVNFKRHADTFDSPIKYPITREQIVQKLNEQYGIELTSNSVYSDPISRLGTHNVSVSFEGVSDTIQVFVKRR